MGDLLEGAIEHLEKQGYLAAKHKDKKIHELLLLEAFDEIQKIKKKSIIDSDAHGYRAARELELQIGEKIAKHHQVEKEQKAWKNRHSTRFKDVIKESNAPTDNE